MRASRLAAAGLLAAGCVGGAPGTGTGAPGSGLSLRLAEPAPTIGATGPEGLADAVYRAERARIGARAPVPATEAPFLVSAPAGQAFLALSPPRALARGAPPARCHGIGLAQGPDAPGRALRACLADMGDGQGGGARSSGASGAGAEEDDDGGPCGCRLLAIDDVLLAEREAFAYAPGVSGRLLGAASPQQGPLVVAERGGGADGAALAAFLGAAGPVAVAELRPDGGAVMRVLGEAELFTGRREPWGWRRGRLTERLLLSAPDGRRLIGLIGFEPADIAVEGATLGAWPKG